jgi:TolB-like protein
MNNIKVFISYSRKDKKWLTDLKTHLKPLERDELIDIWDDTHIKAGTDWWQETADALSGINVAILLVSAEFLASEFIRTNELPTLLIAAEANGTLILPLIVSACDFKHSELHKFQAVNSPDKPMDKMPRAYRHELLQKVADRVREVVDSMIAETTNSGTRSESGGPSIAVLPFRNESGDLENAIFCNGLTVELVNTLSKVEGLKVPPLSSIFFFENKNVDIDEISRRLQVRWILEGSVRKAQNDLRITAHLVNTKDGYIRRPGFSYDSVSEDIFQTQIKIATDIAEALKVEFDMKAKPSAFKSDVVNPEAYKCYMKGRYFFYQHASEEWLKAIYYFDTATSIEPEYARAYANLSSVLAFAWFYGAMHPNEAIEKWRNTNTRALVLGSELAETHIAVGRFRLLYERNWEEAEREYIRAAEINSKNADAYQQLGLLLAARGHFPEAARAAKTALALEPLSLLVNFHAAAIYWLSSQWDEAFRQIESMIELFPKSHSAYWVKGLIYSMTGEHSKAIEEFLNSIALRDDNHVLSSLAFTYGLSGQKKEALRIIDKLIERQKQRYDIAQKGPYATAYNIAVAYGGIQENDEAFKWLKHAYRENNGDLIYLKVHSTIGGEGIWGKKFRNDQRFQDFLSLVGFKD